MYSNRFREVQFISNPSPDHSIFYDYIVTIKFNLFPIFIIIPDVFDSITEFVAVQVSYLEPFGAGLAGRTSSAFVRRPPPSAF